jgi:ceramide glucosyltransferase
MRARPRYTGAVHLALSILIASAGILAALGVLYSGLALLAAFSFRQGTRRSPEASTPPRISILKAVKGLDPGLLEALRTQCTQEYPAEVELLLGVHDEADPALPTLRALQAEFPAMRIEVLLTPLVLGTNGKVSNLAQLLPHARFDHLLISDADIAVSRRYLHRIVAPFADGRVGLVTAGYRGRTNPPGHPTLGSRLEALAIATDFFPGVLMARFMERGMHFALGSTLLVSRRALAEAGGLEALTNVLADDHDLGERVARAGYTVVLSAEPVSTAVPAYTLGEFWTHQLRWNRTVRSLRPWSYFGLVFAHPIPWAILSVIGTGASLLSIVFLLLAILARMAVAMRVGFGLLRDTQVLRDLVLLPVRDCFGLALWVWSYAGNTVEWRGERFRIVKGRMVRLASQRGAAPAAGGIQ